MARKLIPESQVFVEIERPPGIAKDLRCRSIPHIFWGAVPLNQQALSSFIWSVADILRGDFRQSDYGKIILPFTVLRRLDCVLEPTKQAVLEEHVARQGQGMNPEPFLLRKAQQSFYNTAKLDLRRLIGDQDNIAANLFAYIHGFSPEVRDVFERFEFSVQVDRLAKAGPA